MAQPQGGSGTGCAWAVFGLPFLAVAGLLGSAPANVAYLQLTQPAQLRAHSFWWALAAAAPFAALAVVALAGRRRHGLLVHVRRAVILLASTTAAALVLLVAEGPVLDQHEPGLAAVGAGVVAAAVILITMFVVRRRTPLLDAKSRRGERRDAQRSGGPQRGGRRRPRGGQQTARPAQATQNPSTQRPRRGEIWWGVVPFKDEEGSMHRPFIVLAAHGNRVPGLPITRNDYTYRDDYLHFRPDSPDADLARGSVELSPRTLDLRTVGSRAETPCPASLWRTIDARFPVTPSPRKASDHRHEQAGPQRAGSRSRSRRA